MPWLWMRLALSVIFTVSLTSSADLVTPCRTMRPTSVTIATGNAPFEVTYVDISVSTGDDIDYRLKVTLKAKTDLQFRGVVLQARYISTSLDTTKAVGVFDARDGYITTCVTEYGNGVIFEGAPADLRTDLDSISFIWTAPEHIDTFGIRFKATIVDENVNIWENVYSVPIFEVYRIKKAPPPFTIDTRTCGREKGCYRAPEGCTPEVACDFILTWRTEGKAVKFEMAGKSTGWIAVGLSSDKKMGDDDVIECVYNETRQRYNLPSVEIRHSKNEHKTNTIVKAAGILTDAEAYLRDRRIRCTFTRLIEGNSVLSSLKDSYHLLLAKGRVDSNGNKLRHHVQLYKSPHVTPSKVSLLEIVDISGRARYPLAKLHGIVMVIAWMMSASTAMLMAKYYKPMWPNHDMCKEKVWFALHRGCMSVTFVFTIIGVILIVIHAGGYSTMPELPDKAHPILGIITAILCCINPFIALCRCDTKSKKRPIFNFIHWLVGVIPTILATPTMFIGVNLAKARVPAWTTWCLVIFALFHLIIDLMLMIHDLINTKKNKGREEDFMIHKKHDHRGDLYGKEMNPVGTKFKTRIFFLYIIVVGILGLLVIIGIATG